MSEIVSEATIVLQAYRVASQVRNYHKRGIYLPSRSEIEGGRPVRRAVHAECGCCLRDVEVLRGDVVVVQRVQGVQDVLKGGVEAWTTKYSVSLLG